VRRAQVNGCSCESPSQTAGQAIGCPRPFAPGRARRARDLPGAHPGPDGARIVKHGVVAPLRGDVNDVVHPAVRARDSRYRLRDAGLSGVKLHDLRHFYASGLIAAGCDAVTVQRSLGHAKTTTLNTYAHLWPTAEDRTRKAVESIMSASLGEPTGGLGHVGGESG
jgi:hypothetical protein